jgi:chromosomal replication initiation ATPase DnaA
MRKASKITRDILRDYARKNRATHFEYTTPTPMSSEVIFEKVCEYYNYLPDIVMKPTREREIVLCRHVAMYFSRLKTKDTLKEIGEKIGSRRFLIK